MCVCVCVCLCVYVCGFWPTQGRVEIQIKTLEAVMAREELELREVAEKGEEDGCKTDW